MDFTTSEIERFINNVLLTALNNNDDSLNGGYTIKVNINGDYGYIDFIPTYPVKYAIDEQLNKSILSILSGACYPMLTLLPVNGPEFVATNSGNINTARALRFHFRVGTFSRLTISNQFTVVGKNSIPLMDGFAYDPLATSGHIGLSGASGSGKTRLAIYLLSWFKVIMDANITICDPKLDFSLYGFAKENNISYYYPKLDDNQNQFENDVYEVLSIALNEISHRQTIILANPKVDLSPYIVFIDEAAAFSNKKTKSMIEKLILMGRSARVWVMLAAQGFDANTVISSTARDSLGLRVILSANPTVEDCRYLIKGYDPSSVVIPRDNYPFGRGLIQKSDDGRVVPFLAPVVTDDV